MLSAVSRATKIIVKAINDSITDWLIVTIPKNDRDKVILWATVKAVTTLTKGVEFLFKKNKVAYFKGTNTDSDKAASLPLSWINSAL